MASLVTAKRLLGVTGNDEDADIERLLIACTAYLSEIGIAVDPMPGPVGEAIYLMVSLLHRRTDGNFGVRQSTVEGLGSNTLFEPQTIDAANWKVIRLLTDPYREVTL